MTQFGCSCHEGVGLTGVPNRREATLFWQEDLWELWSLQAKAIAEFVSAVRDNKRAEFIAARHGTDEGTLEAWSDDEGVIEDIISTNARESEVDFVRCPACGRVYLEVEGEDPYAEYIPADPGRIPLGAERPTGAASGWLRQVPVQGRDLPAEVCRLRAELASARTETRQRAQEGLLYLMRNLGSEFPKARWADDLTFVLWDLVLAEGGAAGPVTPRGFQLRQLSESACGWWGWSRKYGSEQFVPEDVWVRAYRLRDFTPELEAEVWSRRA